MTAPWQLGEVDFRVQGDPRFMALVDEIERRFRAGDPRIYILFERLRRLHISKGNDYADTTDHFRNIRQSEGFGVPAWVGAEIRANDKMERIKNAAAGKGLKHESVANSMFDLAAYQFIALPLYFEQQGVFDVDNILASL